jgi:hypothetical protein
MGIKAGNQERVHISKSLKVHLLRPAAAGSPTLHPPTQRSWTAAGRCQLGRLAVRAARALSGHCTALSHMHAATAGFPKMIRVGAFVSELGFWCEC